MDTSSLSYDRPTALLEATYHGVARDILLVIDWEQQTISAETRDPSTVTTTEYRWRGREDAYVLPPLVDAAALREWVESEVVPRAEPLAGAYQTVYEDVKTYGRFPQHENEKAEFDRWMEIEAPPLHDGGLWLVEDWLSPGVPEMSRETTDATIEALADTIVEEAAAENVIIVEGREAVRAYLIDYRQDLRDAVPSPDRYEIEGYEVIEKTATASGTSGHVPVPRKWIGHRVKIVRID